MDSIKTSRELGFFEAARNISLVSDSQEVCTKVEQTMPMPGADFAPRISQVVDYILSFGKPNLMFLSPEIALVEEIAKRKIPGMHVVLTLPGDMDPDSRARLYTNIPEGISVQFLEENYFPGFRPSNGMVVSFGYMAGERLMVLPEGYRCIEKYHPKFYGRKVFVPYVVRENAARFGEWLEVNQNNFTDVWRGE